MDGETGCGGGADEFVAVGGHLLRAPAGDGILIDGEAFVRNHQVGVDADGVSESSAMGTCPVWCVEGKHVGAGFLEKNPVLFEKVGK